MFGRIMESKIGFGIVALLLLSVFCMIGYAAVSDFDRRDRGKAPVAIQKETLTIDYDVDDDEITGTITDSGNVEQIVLTAPDCDGSATITLELRNDDAVAVYQKTDYAENTSTVHRPTGTTLIAGTTTIYIKTSTTQTADREFSVTLYLR